MSAAPARPPPSSAPSPARVSGPGLPATAAQPTLPVMDVPSSSSSPAGAGTEVARFRPRGAARFVGAGFLFVWLCGWFVGEVAAVGIFCAGVIAVVTGRPIGSDGAPSAVALFAIGCFMVLWIAMWTFGGVSAMRELLRLTWFEQVFSIEPEGVVVLEKTGPFRRRIVIERERVVRFVLHDREGPLCAQTGGKRIELTRLGTPAERDALRRTLMDRFGLADAAPVVVEPCLPPGWQDTVDARGGRVLGEPQRPRLIAALICFGICAVGGFVGITRFESGRSQGADAKGPLVLLILCAAIGVGGWALTRRPAPWSVGHGVLERGRFRASRLELRETRDDDGDPWFVLAAVAASDASGDESGTAGVSGPAWRRRHPPEKTLLNVPNDPLPARAFALWLARETRLPLADTTAPEAPGSDRAVDHAADRAAMLAQLAASGSIGARLAQWLGPRLEQ